MCCNYFIIETFNVCCTWNILTVTENRVNFKHFLRFPCEWDQERAKVPDLTHWWSNRHLQSISLWCWQGKDREIYHNAEWQSAHQQSNRREQPEQRKGIMDEAKQRGLKLKMRNTESYNPYICSIFHSFCHEILNDSKEHPGSPVMKVCFLKKTTQMHKKKMLENKALLGNFSLKQCYLLCTNFGEHNDRFLCTISNSFFWKQVALQNKF